MVNFLIFYQICITKIYMDNTVVTVYISIERARKML